MSILRGFLDALHADPDDHLTYAVLGDWLEEQGDPRADLIRVLLAARQADPVQREQLFVKAQILLHSSSKQAFSRLRGVGSLTIDPRGLLQLRPAGIPGEAVTLRPEDWGWVTEVVVSRLGVLRPLPTLMDRLTLPPRVTLCPGAGTFLRWCEVLSAMPLDRFAVTLELQGEYWSDRHTPALAGAFPAGSLRELRLARCGLVDARLEELLPHLSHLRHLDLEGNSLTQQAIELLRRSALAPGLESLSFKDTPLNQTGLNALVNASNWPALRRLVLPYVYLNFMGLTAWLADGAGGLRELASPVFNAYLTGDTSGRHLTIRSPRHFPIANLRELLAGVESDPLHRLDIEAMLAPESYAAVLRSKLLVQTPNVRLGRTPGYGLEQRTLGDGVRLHLGHCSLRTLEALAESPARQRWTHLRVENLSPDRLEYLAPLLASARLRELDLRGSDLDAESPLLAAIRKRGVEVLVLGEPGA